MPDRTLQFSLDESIARRARARAAFLGESLDAVLQRSITAWLGDWGLRFVEHTVKAGET
ncbi:MAG: hypothetical protein H5T70_00405, partial [Chloroflexi bacterium]|nr:hypothetical protein [Chloroflexota bacterium]